MFNFRYATATTALFMILESKKKIISLEKELVQSQPAHYLKL